MDPAVFFGMIDELAAADYRGTFSPHFYNEPLADERLETFVAYVSRRLPHARIRIFTNTTLLTARRFRDLARHGVAEYVVSIDEDRIRRSYERLILELDVEERKRIRPRRILGTAMHNRGGLVKNLTNVQRPVRCHLPRDYGVVNAHGDVVLCYNDYFARHTFGNVARRGLLDIWRDPAFVATREDIARGRFELPLCRACELDPAESGRASEKPGLVPAALRLLRRKS